MRLPAIALLALLIISAAWAEDVPKHLQPFTIEGVTTHHNVRYLPDWRYSDDLAPHRDYRMVMDIHVPDDGQAQHPVIFVVHGGGWGAGSKEGKAYRQALEYFAQRGFVAVGFNYILRPRGMFPQVFWDYHDAARFLRKHATKYKIDPTAFGAIGYSAGGWLISSAGHGSGDLFVRNHQQSIDLLKLADRGWRFPGREQESNFQRVMQNPAPAYPDEYGRFQAISLDFHFRFEYGSGNSPAFNQWAGAGYKGRAEHQDVLASEAFDFSWTTLTHPKYAKKKVHVPGLFESKDKDGRNLAAALNPAGGGEVSAIEAIHAFFKEQLVDNPRTPVPEVWPAWRVVQGPTEVSFKMPAGDYSIRYAALPIAPKAKGKTHADMVPPPPAEGSAAWRVYDQPFEVAPNTVVYAVATSEGRRPSTVAQAHFLQGPPVPKVTSPEPRDLPKATTGQPYAVDFDSDVPADKQRWYLQGDLIPYIPRKQTSFVYPNNMAFNQRTGEWSGTPDKPGVYWVQVWVNDGPGRIAGYRDYRWVVEGEDLSTGEAPVVELEDQHIELVFLKTHAKDRTANDLVRALDARAIRCIAEKDDAGTLLLVLEDDRAEARAIIEQLLAERKFKGEADWR